MGEKWENAFITWGKKRFLNTQNYKKFDVFGQAKINNFFPQKMPQTELEKKSSKLRNGFTIHTAKQKRGGYNSKIFF